MESCSCRNPSHLFASTDRAQVEEDEIDLEARAARFTFAMLAALMSLPVYRFSFNVIENDDDAGDVDDVDGDDEINDEDDDDEMRTTRMRIEIRMRMILMFFFSHIRMCHINLTYTVSCLKVW